ncbi:hypothetical protein BJY52DRAFT_1322565 [Lactarius psammicola]|nr:hypothetical protein BJY52DRAFT_1322565 [Lactarius psammicola]
MGRPTHVAAPLCPSHRVPPRFHALHQGYATPAGFSCRAAPAHLPLLAGRRKRDSASPPHLPDAAPAPAPWSTPPRPQPLRALLAWEGRGVHIRGRATRKGLHRLERVNGRAGSPMRGSGREPETGDSAPLYARRVGGVRAGPRANGRGRAPFPHPLPAPSRSTCKNPVYCS